MRPEQIITLLSHTEFFAHLDREGLARLVERSVRRQYKKGHLVFNQGDSGDSLFVLLEGLLKVIVTSERGDEMVLTTFQPPATFGELALVDGRPRSASVEVVEPSTVLVLARSTLLELSRTHSVNSSSTRSRRAARSR